VVGSGQALSGRGKGNEIDAHDVVVHVNNVPQPEFHADVGHRTDILFTSECAISDRYSNQDEIKFEVADGGETWCWSHDNCFNLKGAVFRCPFDYRNSCASDVMAGLVREAVAESYMALGFSRLEVSELVWHMRRPGTPYCCDPSTGFHAVVTMALTCASVDLYGFSGTTTIDGHGVTDGPPGYVGHGIEKEHELLHRMIDHSLPASDYPEATRSSWALTNVVLRD